MQENNYTTYQDLVDKYGIRKMDRISKKYREVVYPHFGVSTPKVHKGVKEFISFVVTEIKSKVDVEGATTKIIVNRAYDLVMILSIL